MRIWSSLIVIAVCLCVAGNVWAADEKKKKEKKGKCPVELFKKLDKDKSGALSEEEFIAPAKNEEGKERAKKKFKKFDKNEDGKVCQKEFTDGIAKRGKKGKKPCDKEKDKK